MGWLNDIGKKVLRFVVPGPAVLVEVIQGKNVGEAVKDAALARVGVPLAVAVGTAEVVADIDNRITQLEAALIQKVGGNGARNLFLDLRRIVRPADAQVVEQIISSAQQFVDTLDPGYLDPLVGLVASEIQRARENFWEQAATVPDAVIAAMPDGLAEVARQTRHILVNNVNTLSLPAFAIDHFQKASAITTRDLVFFQSVPGSGTAEDLHYWAHELTHVRQYRDIGLIEFAKRYVHESIGGGLISLEADADRTACRSFPIAQPRYISSCQDA